MVIFVEPTAFENAVKGLFNGVMVVSCSIDGSGTLAPALSDAIAPLGDVLDQSAVDDIAGKMLATMVDRDGSLEMEQRAICDEHFAIKRYERLVALANLSVSKREAGYQNREEREKERDAAKKGRRAAKSKAPKKPGYNRRQHMRDFDAELAEWDW